MILQFLERHAGSDHVALIDAQRSVTWGEFAAAAGERQRSYAPHLKGTRIGLPFRSSIESFVALAALVRHQVHLFLVSGRATPDQLAMWGREFHWHAWLDSQGELQPAAPAGSSSPAALPPGAWQTGVSDSRCVTILTSGTAGRPKAVRHTWDSLSRPVRIHSELTGSRWLLTYRPHLYAGLQVMLQCFANGGTLVVPEEGASADEVVSLAVRGAVGFASATPSYWRWLLTFADPVAISHIPLRQITLGGEVIDQGILNSLKRLYPAARIVHIYATTELGRCFSVTDNQAGFPASFLSRPSPDGVELRIVNGELQVRSANAMQGYDGQGNDGQGNDGQSCDGAGGLPPVADAGRLCGGGGGGESVGESRRAGAADEQEAEAPSAVDGHGKLRQDRCQQAAVASSWFATGDLVRLVGERVYFAGRRSDMINVGGNKVHPLEVEAVIRELPEVAEVRVFGQESTLVGQLVACEIVVRPGADADLVRRKVQRVCQLQLAAPQRPRWITVVDRLTLTEAGKTSRT